jgi:outer membrane murein-binding lipoprotein Lpp
MSSPKNATRAVRREPGPDTLPALRDMLIQDPRIGKLGVHPNGNGSQARHEDTAPAEIHCAPSITPVTPSIEPKPQQASLQSDGISNDRPSVGKRAFRSVALGFIVIAVGGAAFTLSSYESDKKKDIARAWDVSRSWLSSVLHINSSQGSSRGSDPVAASISKPSDKAPLQSTAALPAVPSIAPAPAPGIAPAPAPGIAPAPAPGIAPAPLATEPTVSQQAQQQLKSTASDLVNLRRVVDQLAGKVDQLAAKVDQIFAKQDQMAKDIATAQAVERNLSQKITSLSQSPTPRIPRKRAVIPPAPAPTATSPVDAYPRLGIADHSPR